MITYVHRYIALSTSTTITLINTHTYLSLYVFIVLFGDTLRLGHEKVFEVGLSSVGGDVYRQEQHAQPVLHFFIQSWASPAMFSSHLQDGVKEGESLSGWWIQWKDAKTVYVYILAFWLEPPNGHVGVDTHT